MRWCVRFQTQMSGTLCMYLTRMHAHARTCACSHVYVFFQPHSQVFSVDKLHGLWLQNMLHKDHTLLPMVGGWAISG